MTMLPGISLFLISEINILFRHLRRLRFQIATDSQLNFTEKMLDLNFEVLKENRNCCCRILLQNIVYKYSTISNDNLPLLFSNIKTKLMTFFHISTVITKSTYVCMLNIIPAILVGGPRLFYGVRTLVAP